MTGQASNLLRTFARAAASLLVFTAVAQASDPTPLGPPSGPVEADQVRYVASANAAAHGPELPQHASPARSQEHASGSLEERPLGFAGASRDGAPGAGAASGGWGWTVRTGGALVIVVSLIFACRLTITRLAGSRGTLASHLGAGGRSPAGLLEVLGRYPVGRGQTLILLKLDRQVLLLNQNGNGFSTLCTVSEPEDVASILVKARDEEGDSIAQRFGTMLRRFDRDPEVYSDELTLEPERIVGPARLPDATDGTDVVDVRSVLRDRIAGLRGYNG